MKHIELNVIINNKEKFNISIEKLKTGSHDALIKHIKKLIRGKLNNDRNFIKNIYQLKKLRIILIIVMTQ